MNNLSKHTKNKLTHFMWKDSKEIFYRPEDMKTKHIFFTLRMIWNHAVPKDMQILPYKKYSFGSFYTKEYIKRAIKDLLSELSKRDDLTPYFKKCLTLMLKHRKMIAFK